MTTVPTTQQPPKKGWFARANKKLLFAVVAMIAVIGILIGTSLKGALSYYVTVDELLNKGQAAYGDRVRVGGRVLDGTIVKDAQNNLSFTMFHNEASSSIKVQYKGVVPDIFDNNTDVIVQGKLQQDGVFKATNLISQHPPEFRMAEPGRTHEPIKPIVK